MTDDRIAEKIYGVLKSSGITSKNYSREIAIRELRKCVGWLKLTNFLIENEFLVLQQFTKYDI